MNTDLSDLLGADETDPSTIHESELADLLAITANRIRTLTRDGVLSRSGKARYSRREAIRAYCTHLRDVASRGGKSGPASAELEAEKIRVQRETADKIALHNAAARGELIPVADVRREWLSIVTDLRSAVLAIPARVAGQLALDREAAAALDREVRDALEGIGNVE